ncbi:hypothetical protein [Sediminitomix flava]|uniref:SnoaL-like protein n=1 Tax=Sediminitomix flava TaxID=379075 RepID=A0A315ZAD7_SEDFL|nr:hypothetical protein [Sediminitomix flava]PWJ42023.1 hypothetical protein BC781_103273 [Sediminitomix flava]
MRAFTTLLLLLLTGTLFAPSVNKSAEKEITHNDVKSFVYKWFANIEKKEDRKFFHKHLPKEKIDMLFPDFPIRTTEEFDRWYEMELDKLSWNSHDISELKVNGNETLGWKISIDLTWETKTENNKANYLNQTHTWDVVADNKQNFVIKKFRVKNKEVKNPYAQQEQNTNWKAVF